MKYIAIHVEKWLHGTTQVELEFDEQAVFVRILCRAGLHNADPPGQIYYLSEVRIFFKKSRIAFQRLELDIKRLFFKLFYGITPAPAREQKSESVKEVKVFFHFTNELLHPSVKPFHYSVKKSLASVLLHEVKDRFINLGLSGNRVRALNISG